MYHADGEHFLNKN